MARELSPEVKSALRTGMIAEYAALAAGAVLAYTTGQMYWIIVFALAGSAVLLFLMHRAGAFKKHDDRG